MDNLEKIMKKVEQLDGMVLDDIVKEMDTFSAANFIEILKKRGLELSAEDEGELIDLLKFDNKKESVVLNDDMLEQIVGGTSNESFCPACAVCSVLPFLAGCPEHVRNCQHVLKL